MCMCRHLHYFLLLPFSNHTHPPLLLICPLSHFLFVSTAYSSSKMFQSECDEARSRELAHTVNLNLSFLHNVSTSLKSSNNLKSGGTNSQSGEFSKSVPISKYSSYSDYVFRLPYEIPPELLTADRLIRENSERSHSVAGRRLLGASECWVPVDILPLLCLHPTQALNALTSYGTDLGYDYPSQPEGVSAMRESRVLNRCEVHGISPPLSIISQALSTYL